MIKQDQKSQVEKAPGRGRPATGRDPLISVRVPAELIQIVDAIAGFDNTNRSDVLRSAFLEGLAALLLREDFDEIIRRYALDPAIITSIEIARKSDEALRKIKRDASHAIQAQVMAVADALNRGHIEAVIKALALDPDVYRGLEQAIEQSKARNKGATVGTKKTK